MIPLCEREELSKTLCSGQSLHPLPLPCTEPSPGGLEVHEHLVKAASVHSPWPTRSLTHALLDQTAPAQLIRSFPRSHV
jgi:hypothetical protein